MSQFRRTGVYYVSQWNGDDLNAGTDPLLPKKTIASLPATTASVIVVGAGHYTEVFSTAKNIVSDGKVIVDAKGGGLTGALVATNIHFKNVNSTVGAFSGTGLTECIFEECAGAIAFTLIKSVIIKASGNFQLTRNTPNGALRNCLLFANCTVSAAYSEFSYCYLDNSYFLVISPTTLHINNVFNGKLRVSGVDYEAKLLADGSTRPDANPLIPDIITVFPAFYTQGNCAATTEQLKFIDIISRTVEAGSILLSKSNTNGFIGNVKIGRKIDLNESGFTITKTNIDESNPNFWKIATGQTFAKVRITGKVSDNLISNQILDIRIPFNFDGDVSGNTETNNNVPDAWNARVTPDTKGTKPNRLTFEVRSSQLTNPGIDVDADWDNDNANSPSIAGRYYLMEYGQPLAHHVIAGTAYGNADANAINAAVKLAFNYRSLDIIITITNDRVI